MKKDIVKKHIKELREELRLSSGEFHRLICDAIAAEGNESAKYPELSTTDRWFNAVTDPDRESYPYIAEALGVSEDEIALGKKPRTEVLEEEVQRLGDLLKLDDGEKKKLSALLIMEGYFLRLFAVMLISLGTIYLNSTLWKNGLVYLIPLILIAAVLIYDKKREKRITGKRNNPVEQAKSNIKFLKTLLKKDLVSRLALNLLLVMLLIIFLPSIESFFYRGKFFVSCTVYFATALILLVKSIDR